MTNCFGNIPSSLIIALVAVAWGGMVYRWVSHLPSRLSGWGFLVILIPFLMPVIAIGYVYANWSLALVRHPALNYCLYCFLQILRLAPVAVVIFRFTPVFILEAGSHCLARVSSAGMNKGLYLKYVLTGPLRRFFLAFVVVFLFAFNEFEAASLMSVSRWTVALFDAHAQGLYLSESVKLCVVPCLIEFLLVISALLSLRTYGNLTDREFGADVRVPRLCVVASCVYLLISWVMLIVIPCWFLISGSRFDLSTFSLRKSWMAEETMVSMMFGVVVAVCACALTNMVFLMRDMRKVKTLRISIVCLMFCGLISTLPLSLILFSAFQLPVLIKLRNTPMPLLVGLLMAVLPYAFFMRWILQPVYGCSSRFLVSHSATSENCGHRLLARELWRYRYAPFCWTVAFIFLLAFFDLTMSAILLPPGMTGLVPRLHELMHYQHSMKLSSTVFISLFIPGLFFLMMTSMVRGFLLLRLKFTKK